MLIPAPDDPKRIFPDTFAVVEDEFINDPSTNNPFTVPSIPKPFNSKLLLIERPFKSK